METDAELQATHAATVSEVSRRLTRAVFTFAKDNHLELSPADVARAFLVAATTLATAAEGPAAAAGLLRQLADALERDDRVKPN